jgi:hypothetical protein
VKARVFVDLAVIFPYLCSLIPNTAQAQRVKERGVEEKTLPALGVLHRAKRTPHIVTYLITDTPGMGSFTKKSVRVYIQDPRI